MHSISFQNISCIRKTFTFKYVAFSRLCLAHWVLEDATVLLF